MRSATTTKKRKYESDSHLWVAYRKNPGDAQRNAIIERHYPFLCDVALSISKTLPSGIERDDLISYGTIGMMEAIKSYDETRKMKFTLYAVRRVRGAMMDGLRSSATRSRDAMMKSKSLLQTEENLRQELHREPASHEVIEKMKIKPKLFNRYHRNTNHTSLNSAGNNEATAGAILADPRPDSKSLQMEFEEVWEVVKKCMPERDQRLLKCIYLDGRQKQSLTKELGLSHATQVSTLHKKVIEQLQYIFRKDRQAA